MRFKEKDGQIQFDHPFLVAKMGKILYIWGTKDLNVYLYKSGILFLAT